MGDPATKAVGSLDRETAGRPSRVRFANAAGVPALTTNLRVAKLVPEFSIATAVSPQFQRRDMAVAVVPIMARPYRLAGSLLRGDQLPVVGQTTHLRRLALRLDLYRRVTQPQIGQRDTAPGPRQQRDTTSRRCGTSGCSPRKERTSSSGAALAHACGEHDVG